ncbi:MAG: RNA-binding protein [Candidatus Thermoplasmatota archaeon]
MTDVRLRKRHRMRQKDIASVASAIEAATGARVFSASDTVDMAEGPGYDAIMVDGKVMAVVMDGVPFLTVRGLLRYPATKGYVTVDMGAVRFVANGADVMGPGVVDADPGIAEGVMVWIRDERNRRPLAIGRALVTGEAMRSKPKGKVVSSVHFVGDKLWLVDEEEEEAEEEGEGPPEPDQ